MPGRATKREDELEATYARYARSHAKQKAWSATNRGNLAIRAELAAAATALVLPALGSRGTLLDVGCGTGWWLSHLAAAGIEPGRLHGVDLLTARVELAAATVPGASVAVADAAELPFPDGGFAAVTAFTALSSIEEPTVRAQVLRELRRACAADARVVIYEPRMPNPMNRATRLVAAEEVAEVLGPARGRTHLTLLPPLARRLGRATERVYPRLARMSVLRTHQLSWYAPNDLGKR